MTVRKEIETILAAYASSKGIPIAYENVAFKPPAGGEYIKIVFVSSAVKQRDVAAKSYAVYGKILITVYGKVGVGTGRIEALADEIAALYPVVPKLPLTSIESYPDTGEVYITADYVCVPVSINYRAEYSSQ